MNQLRFLSRYRTSMENTMTDTATIARTGLTTKCRVERNIRYEQIEGFPHWSFIPRWWVLLPYNVDVQGGDDITVVHNGTSRTYRCITARGGNTLDSHIQATCVQMATPSNFIASTDTATFVQEGTKRTASSPVTVVPVDQVATVVEGQMSFTHRVIWPSSVTFSTDPEHQHVKTGDVLLLPWLKNGRAELNYVQHWPLAGVSSAYFHDE